VVRIRRDGVESTGHAAATDTLEASLKAYLSAVEGTRRAEEVA